MTLTQKEIKKINTAIQKAIIRKLNRIDPCQFGALALVDGEYYMELMQDSKGLNEVAKISIDIFSKFLKNKT